MVKEITGVKGRTFEGKVVSDKMEKTIVVDIIRTFKHPVLGKIIKKTKKYKVHDEKGAAKVGDLVEVSECRPLSKDKHLTLNKVLRQA